MLHRQKLNQFSDAFAEAVAARMTESEMEPVIVSDGMLRPEEQTLAVAEMLQAGGHGVRDFPSRFLMALFHCWISAMLGPNI